MDLPLSGVGAIGICACSDLYYCSPNFYLARFYIQCLVVKYEGVSLAKISGNNTLTLNLSPVTNLARREGTVYTFGAV